jgi:hypothetical protein
VTGAIMLAIVLLAWALLVPLRGTPEIVPMAPAPVEIVPPPR